MPQITISPTPIFAGQTVTITAGPNMRLSVMLDGVQTCLTTDANGEVDYTPPNDGPLYVSDPAGNWQTASEVVQP